MNLDEELTATLAHEAQMRSVPVPDVAGLIRRGRIRRRRRNVARIGVAAAAAVLLGGAAYGVTQVDPPDPRTAAGPPATSETEPSSTVPPSFQHLNGTAIEGTYRMLVGADPSGARIEAGLTITGPNWAAGEQPVVSDGDTWAGVGIYQPDAVAGVTPCTGDWQGRDAGGTPQALAQQLVELPWSTIVVPPTPTAAFGYDAIHLRLRVDDRCPDGYYKVAEASVGTRGISYGNNTSNEVLIDFWVVDMDGTAVVVDTWHQVHASTQLVGRVAEVRDSITLVTDE